MIKKGQVQHDKIAEAIAKARGGTYDSNKGADVRNAREAIEVGTDPAQVKAEMRQLQGYNKKRYVAGPQDFVKAAMESTKGTKIGVMTQSGRVVKPAKTVSE
jgi:hypothetical protein